MKNFSSPFLFFISGVIAAGAINIFTSQVENLINLQPFYVKMMIVVTMGMSSFAIASIAYDYETLNRWFENRDRPSLSEPERQELKSTLFKKIRLKVSLKLLISILFLMLCLSLPRLLN